MHKFSLLLLKLKPLLLVVLLEEVIVVGLLGKLKGFSMGAQFQRGVLVPQWFLDGILLLHGGAGVDLEELKGFGLVIVCCREGSFQEDVLGERDLKFLALSRSSMAATGTEERDNFLELVHSLPCLLRQVSALLLVLRLG